MKTLDFFYTDLTPEAQKDVLEFYGLDEPIFNPESARHLPLFTLEREELESGLPSSDI